MKRKHSVLIVEDEPATADDLAQVLQSLDCATTTVDNRREAGELVESRTFCLVLLDLEIKNEPSSMRGSEEGGRSLLRALREIHPERAGMFWRLPIVIVSNHVKEADLAVALMRQGASHTIQKPLRSSMVSETVRTVLAESGRATHDLCSKPFAAAIAPGARLVLSIPGDRRGRGARVGLGGRDFVLSDAPLLLLLRLVLARVKGAPAHKTELGGRAHEGHKGISVLKAALRAAADAGETLIENDYAGNYWLAERIDIGVCDYEALRARGTPPLTAVADELERRRARKEVSRKL